MSPDRAWQRTFAETLRRTHGLRSARLVDAFATVPRERFLPPGPWQVVRRGEALRPPPAAPPSRPVADPPTAAPPPFTATADPREVHDDVSVAIDARRHLFNGAPGTVATWLDALDVQPGHRVLHIGCGTGYYTALLAALTGPSGMVFGIDVDAGLVDTARAALAPWPWASATTGDGQSALPDDLDTVLVHAGVTHVLREWVRAASHGGARIAVPLSVTFPGLPTSLSKGTMLFARRDADGQWTARLGDPIVIYAAAGLRDEAANARLGRALLGTGATAPTRLRLDAHDESPSCWLHGDVCVSA